MRTKLFGLAVTLAIALLLPSAASAKRITVQGSLAFTLPGGGIPTGLVVTTVMSNPGLEKVVAQQLPLPGPIYVVPFFVDEEKGNSGPSNLRTVVALTNTTDASLTIVLTIREADGDELQGSPHEIKLGPFETQLISLSDKID